MINAKNDTVKGQLGHLRAVSKWLTTKAGTKCDRAYGKVIY